MTGHRHEYEQAADKSPQVAAEVGYESEAAFNRAFKRRFGKPPALYRRTYRQQRQAAIP